MEFDLDTLRSFLRVVVPSVLSTYLVYRALSVHMRTLPQGKGIPCGAWHRFMQGVLGNKFSIIGCWGGSLSGNVMVFYMATAGGVAADYLLRRWHGNDPAPYPRTFQEADSMYKCSIVGTTVVPGVIIPTLYIAVALAIGLLAPDAFIWLAYSMETYTDFIGRIFTITAVYKNGFFAQGQPGVGMLYSNTLAMQFVLMMPFLINIILYSTNRAAVTSRAMLHFGSLTNSGIIKSILYAAFMSIFLSFVLFILPPAIISASGGDSRDVTMEFHIPFIAILAIMQFLVPAAISVVITLTANLILRLRGELPVPRPK